MVWRSRRSRSGGRRDGSRGRPPPRPVVSRGVFRCGGSRWAVAERAAGGGSRTNRLGQSELARGHVSGRRPAGERVGPVVRGRDFPAATGAYVCICCSSTSRSRTSGCGSGCSSTAAGSGMRLCGRSPGSRSCARSCRWCSIRGVAAGGTRRSSRSCSLRWCGAWQWVPRFEHVLVDQTGVGPDGVEGGLKGRIAQLLMMAAYGRHAGVAMEGAARLLASLSSGGGVNYLRLFLVYVMATQDEAAAQAFDAALRGHGREHGGEIMSYAQQLLEEGRSQGREEGRNQGREEGARQGKVEAVEGLLRVGVSWDVIESATGLNEARFHVLKEELSASDRSDRQGVE